MYKNDKHESLRNDDAVFNENDSTEQAIVVLSEISLARLPGDGGLASDLLDILDYLSNVQPGLTIGRIENRRLADLAGYPTFRNGWCVDRIDD